MADLNDLIEDSNAKLSRRNVVVGTAWAVPAILAVGAAPAFADSKQKITDPSLSGTRGASGNAKKVVTFTFKFTTLQAINTIVVTTDQPTGFTISSPSAPTTLGAGAQGTAEFTLTGQTGGQTVPAFVITISYKDGSISKSATFSVASKTLADGATSSFTGVLAP